MTTYLAVVLCISALALIVSAVALIEVRRTARIDSMKIAQMRPGDALFITTTRSIDDATAVRIRNEVQRIMPRGARAILLDKNLDAQVVIRGAAKP